MGSWRSFLCHDRTRRPGSEAVQRSQPATRLRFPTFNTSTVYLEYRLFNNLLYYRLVWFFFFFFFLTISWGFWGLSLFYKLKVLWFEHLITH